MAMVVMMAAAAVAAAQAPAIAPAPSPEIAARRIAHAGTVGRMLYTLDRAAWAATDALTTVVPKDTLRQTGGYVVEPRADGALTVTFYRGEGSAARAFFTASVKAGKVVASALIADPMPLSPMQARMAAARSAAASAAIARGFRPCTPAPFNTVIIPVNDPAASVPVFLLSAPTDPASYPAGGHYRIMIGPDGKDQGGRPYTRTCIPLGSPRQTDRAKSAGLALTHLLDPLPSEIHVFLSYVTRLPLYVGIPDRGLWKGAGSTITKVDPAP